MSNFRRRLLMMQSKPLPQWFKEALVCWYDPHKQGLTNDYIKEHKGTFLLKDFSRNKLDMTMHNFAGKGMSGMGGYGIDLSTLRLNDYFGTIQVTEKELYFKAFDNASPNYPFFSIKDNILYNKVRLRFESNAKFTLDGKPLINGINEIELSVSSGKITPRRDTSQPAPKGYYVKVEILPLHPGSLVFDGVDDYGVSRNQPLLTDYTWIAKREIIKIQEGTNPYKKAESSVNGSFGFYCDKNKVCAYSFNGSFTYISDIIPKNISYQTKEYYNGRKLKVGTSEDYNKLFIGIKTEMALYQFLLFNRTLTQDEIDWTVNNIMGGYPNDISSVERLKSEIQ